MRRIPYRLAGVVLDGPDSEVAPDYWTGCVNAIPRDNQMVTPAGFRSVLADPGARTVGLVNTTAEGTSYWVVANRNGLIVLEPDATTTDATPTSGWSTTGANGWTINDCCMALLNGYPVVKLGGNAPVHWDADLGNDFVFATSNSGATAWDLGTIGALWVFRNHVFVGDVGGDANVVAWSDAVPPAVTAGTTGIGFYPAATNQAGNTDLGDMTRIQNGLSLNRSCMIYGRSNTYVCNFVGGQFVFDFRLFSGEAGAISRHSMTDIGNAHVVMTQDDIVLNDGQRMQSIADQFVRREIFSLLDESIASEVWLQHYREENEVWVGIPQGGNGVNLAAVYNLGTRRWGFRSLKNSNDADSAVTTVAYGIISETSVDQLWSDFSATDWDTVAQTWDASGFTDDREKLVGGLQTVRDLSGGTDDGLIIEFDGSATDQGGSTITTTLQRYGLDLGAPDDVKTVIAVHINGETDSAGLVRVGGRMYENGPTEWSSFNVFSLDGSQQADITATGRLIDVELVTTAAARIAGFTLELGAVSPY